MGCGVPAGLQPPRGAQQGPVLAFRHKPRQQQGRVVWVFFSNFYFKSHNWSLTKSDPVIGARAGGSRGVRGALLLPPPCPGPASPGAPEPGARNNRSQATSEERFIGEGASLGGGQGIGEQGPWLRAQGSRMPPTPGGRHAGFYKRKGRAGTWGGPGGQLPWDSIFPRDK